VHQFAQDRDAPGVALFANLPQDGLGLEDAQVYPVLDIGVRRGSWLAFRRLRTMRGQVGRYRPWYYPPDRFAIMAKPAGQFPETDPLFIELVNLPLFTLPHRRSLRYRDGKAQHSASGRGIHPDDSGVSPPMIVGDHSPGLLESFKPLLTPPGSPRVLAVRNPSGHRSGPSWVSYSSGQAGSQTPSPVHSSP
jgi:hypothetical protein